MKHEIEIQDLPEGWEAVAYRTPDAGEYYLGSSGVKLCESSFDTVWLIVRKKQPRRIVLEETDIDAGLDWNDSIHLDDIVINIQSCKNWKIVEDNKCAE